MHQTPKHIRMRFFLCFTGLEIIKKISNKNNRSLELLNSSWRVFFSIAHFHKRLKQTIGRIYQDSDYLSD
jgi:hypothetical protein